MADETRTSSDQQAAPASSGEGSPGVYRYRVRRTPNIAAFLVTGAFFGALVGFSIDYFGPNGCAKAAGAGCTAPYSPGVSLAYFLVLGALVGLAVAAMVVVALDKYLSSR